MEIAVLLILAAAYLITFVSVLLRLKDLSRTLYQLLKCKIICLCILYTGTLVLRALHPILQIGMGLFTEDSSKYVEIVNKVIFELLPLTFSFVLSVQAVTSSSST